MSNYQVLKKVIDYGNISHAADALGYSQGAVSLIVKSIEKELGVKLLKREKIGVSLTRDGEAFLPYIINICNAENALEEKHKEMHHLKDAIIRIGSITSVGRNLLPPLIQEFKLKYPEVHFDLSQGNYDSIIEWTKNGTCDFCFVNSDFNTGLKTRELFKDSMMAVLPPGDPLASQQAVSLAQLARRPYIELDEGKYSSSMLAFSNHDLKPNTEYKIHDNYTILSMIRQGLGVSVINRLTLMGVSSGVEVRPIRENITRTVSTAIRSRDTLPLASTRFMEYMHANVGRILSELEDSSDQAGIFP